MASPVVGEEGVAPSGSARLGFDVQVFRTYLVSLLLPGKNQFHWML